MSLTKEDIKVGKMYRPKWPLNIKGLINDRLVKRILPSGAVEFDGPSCGLDGRCCIVPMENFLAWAKAEVEGPAGKWRKVGVGR